jgi:rubrerythrin
MKIINKKTNEIIEARTLKDISYKIGVHYTTVYRMSKQSRSDRKGWEFVKEVKKDNNLYWQCQNNSCKFTGIMPPTMIECPVCKKKRKCK